MPARLFDGALATLQRTLRGRNVILNGFELWFGLAAMSTLVAFLDDPSTVDQGPVAHAVGHAASVAWVFAYTLAGASIWYGLLRPAPLWEVVGLWLLGTSTLVQAITILGVVGTGQTLAALVVLAVTPAAWVRALIVEAAVLRLAREHEETAGRGG